jgi:hypothetical protein
MEEQSEKKSAPLVELAPDEAVLPALSQSAHPVEFVEANKTDDGVAQGVALKRDES